jgi:hypothetical protein
LDFGIVYISFSIDKRKIKMKIKSTHVLIIAIFFTCISSIKNTQAQNEDQTKSLSEQIDKVTKKMQLKLILSNEQLTKINNILVESIPKTILKEQREKILNAINQKIESVLTKRQKTKFDILKSKWLDEIIGASQ